MLSYDGIKQELTTAFIGHNLILKDVTESTNDDLKALTRSDSTLCEGTVIVSKSQKNGKGRRGRIWNSPSGSLSMSILLKPDIAVSSAPRLTLLSALAVADAVTKLTGMANGLSIKWPNDLLLHKKKFCGILTEMIVGEPINYIVLGIGLNVNMTDIPKDLADAATSLQLALKKTFSLAKLTAYICNRFEDLYLDFIKCENLSGVIDRYNSLLINLNQSVRVLDPKLALGGYDGTALGVNETGGLIVETKSGIKIISSGEVSVRGLYGYV